MSAPLISIIIPVWNGSNYLEQAVDSALAQTWPNCEIIVINDGSDDLNATENIALSYGDKIRYFRKENGGTASALNYGLRVMKGTYFSWLSHDDLYKPEKVTVQINFLSQLDDPLAICYSPYIAIDAAGSFLEEVTPPSVPPHAMLWALLVWNVFHGCSFIVPVQAFTLAGTFNENLPTTQDYDTWLRLAEHCSFYCLPEPLVYGRRHAKQDSAQNSHFEEIRDYYRVNAYRISGKYMKNAFSPDDLAPAYQKLISNYASFGLVKESLRFAAQMLLYIPWRHKFLTFKPLLKKILNRIRINKDTAYRLDFSKIFKENIFQSQESASGVGSELSQTKVIREKLPEIFKELSIKTLLDIPCGDFNWMRTLCKEDMDYIGGDIVEDIVKKNNDSYANAHTRFLLLDILTDQLPAADMLLCRDCLVHLPYSDIFKFFSNIKRSKIKYLTLTTFPEKANQNFSETCQIWRPLNMQAPPFNLPKPIILINEGLPDTIDPNTNMSYVDKSLAIWDLAEVYAHSLS
jgi:glycosyltransferase involved in cell wall biosynthesis